MEKIIFKTIVGSQAYGTAGPNSDIDIKGIYMQDIDELITFGYKEQYEVSKDETYYELRRFLQLLESANPTVLEMLFMPANCVLIQSPEFELISKNRLNFLTKRCHLSFAGYAIAQIKKAKSLDKKLNWEDTRIERKDAIDFCYVYVDGTTYAANQFLKNNNFSQEKCGMVKLNHIKDSYALYYSDTQGQYKGVFSKQGNEIKLSSVAVTEKPLAMLYFNKEGYSRHCKDYLEYTEWLANRNTQRYVDIAGHNQKIDGKNLLHCRRLLDMALEIAEHKTLTVSRPNAEYLLKIRKGEVDLETIINQAEEDIVKLEELYKNSDLPEAVSHEFVNELLLEIRHFKC